MIVFTQNALKGIPENAILIGHFGEIVLCKLVKNKYTPFVVWTLGYNCESVCWGHYFGTYKEAVEYFSRAVKTEVSQL